VTVERQDEACAGRGGRGQGGKADVDLMDLPARHGVRADTSGPRAV